MIRKSGNRFSLATNAERLCAEIMPKRNEILIRWIGSESQEWRASPASVAPADGSFRGAGPKLAPFEYLPVENAPLRRKGLRAVRSPSFTARSFSHDREGGSLPCTKVTAAPW